MEYKLSLKLSDDFRNNGIQFLDTLNKQQINNLISDANDAYFNKNPFLTDNEYDIIREYAENKYPTIPILSKIGASVTKNKVKLPYFMGSMEKIKPNTNELKKWTEKFKGPYIVSCKLDGVSGLYSTEGLTPKLYTKGNSFEGQDISNFITFLKLPKKSGIVLRGEFIIRKDIFNTKYKGEYSNSRNMVAGIINSKNVTNIINDIDFVAYEVIKPELKPSKQLEFLNCIGANVVLYDTFSELTNNLLSDILINWRQNYIYEIDGIIPTNDMIYERKNANPKHAFAFKMVLTDQIAEAKVVDVLWGISKDGYLKPRVQIEPIYINGVLYNFVNGQNASFIYNNNIGVGSLIEMIRSNDVIPYIRKVIVPSQFPKMPNIPFKWNDTNVDIIIDDDIDTNDDVIEKNICGFFRIIDVDGLREGNIKRIIEAGFNSIPKIIKMSESDFLKIDGFKDKMAKKIYISIQDKIKQATLQKIMVASNKFGRGFSEKKIEVIMESYPNILLSSETEFTKIKILSSIKGMALKTSKLFVERIPKFLDFIKEIGLESKLNENNNNSDNIDKNNLLFGKTIVMSGFRDYTFLKKFGVKIGTSISSKTFILLVKDKTETTEKINKAKELNIPIITLDEFNNKYNKII